MLRCVFAEWSVRRQVTPFIRLSSDRRQRRGNGVGIAIGAGAVVGIRDEVGVLILLTIGTDISMQFTANWIYKKHSISNKQFLT